MPVPSRPLLILGASARAAAFSACEAGFAPTWADLFADADVRRCGAGRQVTDYPLGLLAAAQQAPPGPWMYTGALENHPRLVGEIASARELLGNSPAVLRRVRDPLRLAAVLRRHGLACPDVTRRFHDTPQNGRWLRKPLRSSCGAGIEVWDASASVVPRRDCYYQQRIEGTSCSAVFVADGRTARLLGVTEQQHVPSRFQYAGSLGPVPLSPPRRRAWERLGECIAGEFRLKGLFGVDAIANGRGVWAVEVNPRYTASVEILERASSFSAVKLHADACRAGVLPPARDASGNKWRGKRILYAPRPVAVSTSLADELLAAAAGLCPDVADIPVAGTLIPGGRPIMTVFAAADDRHTLLLQLDAASEHWLTSVLG